MVIITSKILLKEYKTKKLVGYKFDKTDIHWNVKTVIKIFFIAYAIGCLAASVGIGGGVLMGPVLLEIGMNSTVANHTTNFLVLFTSSSSSIQFYLQDLLSIEYAGFAIFVALFSGVGGVKLMKYFLTKVNKEYPIIIALAAVLLLSTLALLIYAFYNYFNESEKFGFFNVEGCT